jgi:hypothetical protein
MGRTWKPTTAGILAIIVGAIDLIFGIVIATVGIIGSSLIGWLFGAGFPGGFLSVIGVPLIVLGIVAIVGGIHALNRKTWGLALTGSICALVSPGFLLGLLAIIFVSLGKGEFE